jgi:protein-disulfide isomerase
MRTLSQLYRQNKSLLVAIVIIKMVVAVSVVYAEGWLSNWWPKPEVSQSGSKAAPSAVSAPADAATPATTSGTVPSRQQILQTQPQDRVKGSPMAPVTIIEYASLSCSHCASFHTETLPKVQKNWIDTGKANYVLRDLPWDNMAFGMAKIARCAPPAQFYSLIDIFFTKQKDIFTSANPLEELKTITAQAGMSPAQTDACIADPALHEQVLSVKNNARNVLQINGTPAFFINGTEVDGAVKYEVLNKALEAAYAAKANR